MSIDSIVPVPPVVAQIEAQFAQLGPSLPSGLAAPSDPFSVLLDAVTVSSGTATSGTAVANGGGATAVAVEPQLVSLASSSPAATSQTATSETASSQSVVAAESAGASGGTSSASGAAIVSEASRFLGVPYVWGGSSPSGFDCSGLVQYVFGQLGVTLPRGSVDQSEVGTPVASLAQAQPGDLLFFEPGANGAPPGKPGHVGIYIGNDEMIDAPETGETVQIQAVPCPPLDIRRVVVPVPQATSLAAGSTPEGDQSAVATLAAATVLASGGASVQMGKVSVPAQYAGLVEQASARSGTPAPLLAAILYNESRFQPDVVSSAGAEGIAQFMPATAAAHGVAPFDPSSAIPGAADLLAQFHAAFGSWTDAIAAYAAGGGAVEAAGGVPRDGSTPAYVARTLTEAGMAPGS